MSEFLLGVMVGFFAHYIVDGLKAVKELRDLHSRVASETEKHFKRDQGT